MTVNHYPNLAINLDNKTMTFAKPTQTLDMTSAMYFSRAYQKLSTYEHLAENIDDISQADLWDIASKAREMMFDNVGMTEYEALDAVVPGITDQIKENQR